MSDHGTDVPPIDPAMFRSHCLDWLGFNEYAVEECFNLCDENDRLRDVLVDIAAAVPAAHRNDGRDVPERIRDGAAAEAEVDRLRAENGRLRATESRFRAQNSALRDQLAPLRDLLAKALPWIDPNDSHEDYLLTVEIRQAIGEGS